MVDIQLLGLLIFFNFVELFNFDGLSTLLENQILGLANLEKKPALCQLLPTVPFQQCSTCSGFLRIDYRR